MIINNNRGYQPTIVGNTFLLIAHQGYKAVNIISPAKSVAGGDAGVAAVASTDIMNQ